MSVFFRKRPAGPVREQIPFGAHRIPPGASYGDIDMWSPEAPLQSIAVRAAVDLISSLASELPVEVYSGAGADRRLRPTPGYLLDPGGDGHGLPDWCYQVVQSWLLRGNVYGDILATSPSGFPTQILPMHPDCVAADIDGSGIVHWTVDGSEFPSAKMLHRRVNPVAGLLLGLSPVAMHARAIGLSLTATQFGLQWFRDGAHPGGMLTYEGELSKPQADTAKERFLAALRGSREPIVMGRGWHYEAIQISPEESQFLATQGFTEAQCARIFGPGIAEILGYDSGGSLTYATVEGRSAHLLVYTVSKWLTRLERLLTEMLPKPQYALINRDGLLKSTTLDRYNAYASALTNKWKTVNEVRQAESLPPVDWGDEPNGGASAPAEPAPADDGGDQVADPGTVAPQQEGGE
jgi:HK97 family phage portal protein